MKASVFETAADWIDEDERWCTPETCLTLAQIDLGVLVDYAQSKYVHFWTVCHKPRNAHTGNAWLEYFHYDHPGGNGRQVLLREMALNLREQGYSDD